MEVHLSGVNLCMADLRVAYFKQAILKNGEDGDADYYYKRVK